MQSSTRQNRSARDDVASTLEQCLRTELAAVETYVTDARTPSPAPGRDVLGVSAGGRRDPAAAAAR
jgi:hypothetical protein